MIGVGSRVRGETVGPPERAFLELLIASAFVKIPQGSWIVSRSPPVDGPHIETLLRAVKTVRELQPRLLFTLEKIVRRHSLKGRCGVERKVMRGRLREESGKLRFQIALGDRKRLLGAGGEFKHTRIGDDGRHPRAVETDVKTFIVVRRL